MKRIGLVAPLLLLAVAWAGVTTEVIPTTVMSRQRVQAAVLVASCSATETPALGRPSAKPSRLTVTAYAPSGSSRATSVPSSLVVSVR